MVKGKNFFRLPDNKREEESDNDGYDKLSLFFGLAMLALAVTVFGVVFWCIYKMARENEFENMTASMDESLLSTIDDSHM